MNNLKDRRLKQTLIGIVSLMIISILAVFACSFMLTKNLQTQQQEQKAAIIGIISEKYELSQKEVIELMQSDSLYIDEGKEILEKYGMDELADIEPSYHDFLQSMISCFLILIVLFTISIFILIYIYLKRLDNTIVNISTYINRLLNKDYSLDIIDNDEGTLSSLKNDIYKVTVTMKEQNEELKHDKMYLANNLADISHQLKTPLTSMLIMSELLEGEDLSIEERKKFLGVIRNQLHRIEWLVSSLLKMAKLDAKTIAFKKEKIHTDVLLKKSIEPISMMLEEKNQTFEITGDKGIVELDLNWTSEAFVNILKNCCEHTPINGKLKAHVFDTVMYTEIILSDNGEGISQKDLPFIFERFYRASKSSKDSVGIGLAMAYSIITSQDGTISVQSKLNEGTSFSIRFYKK